ncbi:ROK family protein [Paenibacillus sp. N1-5-1-14]|uniref:ROK family protein n=1 Tax=Paenibacillus radicibacter TaxID=2972488 RepID=UPI0021591F77|nr:ROK family protein [Paenibacillus radicibacter]MCR8641304.1 ROK family protein [Paenibacillus radicibacter]
MNYWVGIDLGGTNMVCGLLDDQMNIVAKLKKPTLASQGSDDIIRRLAETVHELLEQNNIHKNDLQGIGMGSPGFINPDLGIGVFSANLGWKDYPVAARLQELTNVPVSIDNDVRMYVYGESIQGAGRGHKHVLGITLGTGIAAAVVSNGQLFYGGGYMAGEIGHIPMDGVTAQCGCGLVGCLETVASATGIARQAREALLDGRTSLLGDWFDSDSLARLTATDVSKAYDEGDELAKEVMEYTGRALGKGLAAAVTLFSPDCIVIGGGAALAGERLFAPMREEIQKNVIAGYWEKLTIVRGELIDDGGVIGSATFAKSRA